MASIAQPRRVLVGASVRQSQSVFDAYYRSLRALELPARTQVDYVFVSDDPALLWPDDCLVLPAPARPDSALYAVDDVTHRWNVDTFEHLARCKQLLLDYAIANHYDKILLVDSDLLLEPTTLRSLLACSVAVVSAVFWTQWTSDMPPLPQTWLAHPYSLDGLGMQQHEYLRRLEQRRLTRVIGGGACTLIDTSVLDKAHYHPRLQLPAYGMWQGEDRTFAILLQQAHIKQWADPWPLVYHAYRPEQRTVAALDEAWSRLSAPRQLHAKAGDWVNIRLTPMQDPQLNAQLLPSAQNVRGRLGALPLAQPLADALREMAVGDRRIVDVTYPAGTPYPAGLTKAIMVEMIDVRPD